MKDEFKETPVGILSYSPSYLHTLIQTKQQRNKRDK